MKSKHILMLLLSVASIFTACNPVKRVMKNQEQFNKIGRAWLELHKCVNDSVSILLPGDTTYTETTDTVYNIIPMPGDTVIWVKDKIITKIVTKTIHDTLKISVTDKQAVGLLQADLNNLTIKLNESKLKAAELKGSARQWHWISYFSWLVIVFGIVMWVKSKF